MTTAPADIPTAIRETKAELRARIGDVAGAFRRAEEAMQAEVAEVVAQRERGADGLAGGPVRRHRRRHRAGRDRRGRPPARLRGGQGHLPARAGRGLGRRAGVLPGAQRLRRQVQVPRRRHLRRARRGQAVDLPDLLVAAADGGPRGRQHGRRTRIPQLVLEARVRGQGLVRPDPRHRVPGPGPAPRARAAAPAGSPRTPTPARSSDGCCPAYQNVFRHVFAGTPGALRPVGRRLPHRGARVRVHGDVLGVPHLPGLDRAVRHAAHRGRAAHRADPVGDGLSAAAGAAGRRGRRRPVRRGQRPGAADQREVAPGADARR